MTSQRGGFGRPFSLGPFGSVLATALLATALLTAIPLTANASDIPRVAPGTLRIATFNASLNRSEPGMLRRELLAPGQPQITSVAAVIGAVQPDLLLINLLREERGAAQSPYSNVSRLFRRHPAIHWSRPYHSMVDDSVLSLLEQEPHWRLADCGVPALAHDGY